MRALLSRRALLQLGLGLSGVLTLKGLLDFLGFQPEPQAATTFVLESPSAYPIGSATHLPEARAWLLRDAAGAYAISAICPHLGCIVDRRPEGFVCPCHGSRFDTNGQVRNGPAARRLTFLELTLTGDGRLVLRTDRPVSASQRLVAG